MSALEPAAQALVDAPDSELARTALLALKPTAARHRAALAGHPSEANLLGLIGEACVLAGAVDIAESWFEEQILCLEDGEAGLKAVADAMGKAGFILGAHQAPQAGLRWFERADARLRPEAEHADDILLVQYNAGHLRIALGDHDAAVAGLERSLTIARAAGDRDHLAEARALRLMGHSLHAQRRFLEAAAAYERAADAERQGDADGVVNATSVARCLDQVGFNHGSQGDLDEALRWHLEAAEMVEDHDSRDAASTFYNAGHCLKALGREDEARTFLTRADTMLAAHAPDSGIHQRCREALAGLPPAPLEPPESSSRRIWLALPVLAVVAALLSKCV